MTLRTYQACAVGATYDFLRTKEGNPAVVIPTGGGKSHCIAKIAYDTARKCDRRVLVLAHRQELVEQNYEKAIATIPEAEVGIYSAGLQRRDTSSPVLFASIQSVHRRAQELGRFDIVQVDECHSIPLDGDGMYRTFLEDARSMNPDLRVIGWTATPYRLGGGLIHGPDRMFQDVCYEVGVKELIDIDYLSPLITKRGHEEALADLSNIPIRRGEFVESALEDAMATESIVASAVSEIVRYMSAGRRRKCLIFSCSVRHAEMVRRAIEEESGEGCQVVTNETSPDNRRLFVEEFKSDDSNLSYLVNVNVLTEGFDAPNIDCIALLRATQSPGLYYQMVGRGLRRHPLKETCLVLDFGGNVERHGPIDAIRPPAEPGEGEATPVPVKMCPECRSVVHVRTITCPDCGYEWSPEALHSSEATRHNVVSTTNVERLPVQSVTYRVHRKHGAPVGHPRSLRVDYQVSICRRVSEWVCLEHPRGTFPHRKAREWWEKRTSLPIPNSAVEAVDIAAAGLLAGPEEIVVKESKNGFPKIQRHEFRATGVLL